MFFRLAAGFLILLLATAGMMAVLLLWARYVEPVLETRRADTTATAQHYDSGQVRDTGVTESATQSAAEGVSRPSKTDCVVCPDCQNPNAPNYEYCGRCGTALRERP